MKKELAIQTNQAEVPTVTNQTLGDMDFDIRDIMLPRILLLQGTSALVHEGTAVSGEIINSLTGEKLGNKSKPVELIPISFFKTWTILEKDSGKFVNIVPFTGVELPKEERLDDGRIVKNYKTFNFYVLLAEETKHGIPFPAQISFKSKSLPAGKSLNSHFTLTKMNGKRPYDKSVYLGASLQENENGKFYVYTITPGKISIPEAVKMAKQWEPLVTLGGLKVHETDHVESEVEVEKGTPQY